MGIISKVKSLFKKKSSTTPVYQSTNTVQGPVPAGANESKFRSTGVTEGGYSVAPKTTVVKRNGGGSSSKSVSSGSNAVQGPVPETASEETFRQTGVTAGGISKAPAKKETVNQRIHRLFQTTPEKKAPYEQQAYQNIANREKINLNAYQSVSPSTGFTELPYSSISGGRTFTFSPTVAQQKEAQAFASSEFAKLPRIERYRSTYTDIVIGIGRGTLSGARDTSLILSGPFALGYGGLIRKDTKDIFALPSSWSSIRIGTSGKVAEGIASSAVTGYALTAKPPTIITKSASIYSGENVLTVSQIKIPRSYSPTEGFYTNEFAVSASKVRVKDGKYVALTRTFQTNTKPYTSLEVGYVNKNEYNLPVNKLVSKRIPYLSSKGLGITKQEVGVSGYKTSSSSIITPKRFTASSTKSFPVNKAYDTFLIREDQPIIGRSVSIPYKSARGSASSSVGRSSLITKTETVTSSFTPTVKVQQTSTSFKLSPSVISSSKPIQPKIITITLQTRQVLKPIDFKPLSSSTKTTPKPGLVGITRSTTRKGTAVFQIPKTTTAILTTPLSVTRSQSKSRYTNPNTSVYQGIPIKTTTGSFGGFFLPPLKLSPDFGRLSYRGIGRRSQKKGYTPSFSALLFNIRGKKTKGVETGINFRPVLGTIKKRRKKKK